MGILTGIIISAFLDPSILGPSTQIMRLIIFILSVSGVLVMSDSANYWGVDYSLGYLICLIILGWVLMDKWELVSNLAIVLFYITKKLFNKF